MKHLSQMNFEILGEIERIEVIATGNGIRENRRLSKSFGPGKWRKMKGEATIKLVNGETRFVELHWYEAHGIGKKSFKVKKYLE